MSAPSQLQVVAQTVLIGSVYIVLSAGLISFNKYMLDEKRFPHALELTLTHMSMSTLYSLGLSTCVPWLYPTMAKACEQKTTTLKYIAPLGFMFAIALWSSNLAYRYCSVAFLQFCKEGNVALVFFLGCAFGLQVFSWKKLAVLVVIMAGCSLCAEGEINFVMVGFLLQIGSQVAECLKNTIGELVMSGAGMKLDPLTFVAWQAPCSLVPLAVAALFTSSHQVFLDFKANLPLLLLNATLAFMLNLAIATTLKHLSALAFVIIGLIKDIVIVSASAYFFHDPISQMQRFGFGVTLCGIAIWANLKLQEQAAAAAEKAKSEDAEQQPLLDEKQKLRKEESA
eukprot:CAMPEP_0197628252 /NCGR_PEP_ID=MMETSP1338-20131121/6631_1 /TAXON_ID=43686 ORGANISM="Pelagodinium beii, Strain RCC1491" /NCGR_SAMPLE_ID=MMETSP1338 /ASSEMBLY_ACC=CAM_ASM_000754 /LENGTH=339 /DNA_ID=CAMNT_0043199197 /DNA_START=49 /DNA_END=1068 /DNA_ORIENTATION=-